MRTLDRYYLREVLGPLSLGFLVYTFILLIRFLFLSAELIIRRGLPAGTVGSMLLYSLPNVVVLTLPMALLFGILTAVSRLSSDSELIALRACGVSAAKLYRPTLVLSVLLALLNTALMVYALPWGNSRLQAIRLTSLSQSLSKQIEPRVFYEEWADKVVYVFDVDRETDRWKGVFLAQSFPDNQSDVTVADWGEVKLDPSGERVVLTLGNADSHKVDLIHPERYQPQHLGTMTTVLDESFASSQKAKQSAAKGLRELNVGELHERLADTTLPAEIQNLARVEIHKRFSIPAACLVFGLIALPLGFNNRRGGKTSGFALSIGVIMLYYLLINNGEEAARYGRVAPWVAMWLPNLALGALGAYLLYRRNRDRSLLPSFLERWARLSAWRTAEAARGLLPARFRRRTGAGDDGAGAEDATSAGRRLARPKLLFPNLMDRYVLRTFVGVLALVLVSVLAIYTIADLSQKIDEILKNHVPRAVVVGYYLYLSLQMFYELAPIVVLITTLIALSVLSRSNEITAAKALGFSLYRLSVPVLVAAALLAAFAAYLESAVLPLTNQRAQQLEDRIRGEETQKSYARPDRWLFGQGSYIYNFLHYDAPTRTLQRLQVFELDSEHHLKRRLVAANARYDGKLEGGKGGWLFYDGWYRRFDNQGAKEPDFTRFAGPVQVDFPEGPSFFASEVKRPETMTYGELRDYVAALKASGQPVPLLEVELYRKISFPVTALVMALVGLPFAFRLGRQGTLYGIGLAIGLGMVFFAVLALFTALGEAGILPAVVAVWSPSAVFSTLAAYLFLGVRT